MINLTYYKSNVLIIFIVSIVIALFLAKINLGLSFSIIIVISAILAIINKWLWKYWPFSYMFWITDFSGRYEGELEYEYRDENSSIKTGKLKYIKTIHQTGSNINIFSFTFTSEGNQSSLSESKSVYVERMKDEKHYQIIYSYLNDGNPKLGYPPHYGTEIIKFIKKGNKKILSGNYFTNRLPYQTRGSYNELLKVSNNLNHEF